MSLTLSLEGCPFGYGPEVALDLLPEWLRIAAGNSDAHDIEQGRPRDRGHGEILRWLADQFEAQKPRIDEPGLYGVVRTEDAEGLTTYRWHSHDGWHGEDGSIHDWDDLDSPTLVRDGVES